MSDETPPDVKHCPYCGSGDLRRAWTGMMNCFNTECRAVFLVTHWRRRRRSPRRVTGREERG